MAQQQEGELVGQFSQRDHLLHHGDRSGSDRMAEIKLRWRKGEKAPIKMDRWCDAVVGGSVVYYRQCRRGQDEIHAYHTTSSKWSLITNCPVYREYALAVINGTLTTVGGYGMDDKDTNKLFSLTGAGEDSEGLGTWTEEYPPMPTKRYNVSALCTGTSLIVIGGTKCDRVVLKTVEILNTSTPQWHVAAELLQPRGGSSMTVCGDRVYLLGGADQVGQWT